MSGLKREDLPEYTYDDYQLWEGEWELIAGIPYSMAPAPVKKHQKLLGYIFSEIDTSIVECPDCEVLIDEDWKVDTNTVLKPDISVVCDDKNPSYITKTPDVIFEVLSPSTAKRDEGIKFNIYEGQGVQYYVLVYPEDLIAKIYQHNGEKFKKIAECDSETFYFDKVKCPFNFDFSRVFKRFR